MLRAMRSSAKYIALVFVTIPFIVWLVTAQVSSVLGSNPNVVLNVNGKKYQVTEYQQRVQIASDQYRQQNGSAPVSREEDEQIKDQVINQMVQDALLEQEYKRLGIRVSDQEIIEMARNSPPPEVMRDPQFQTDSQFDLRKWQQFLATTSDRNVLAQIEAMYREQIPRIKLAQYLTSDVYVSDAKLWRIYKDQHDSVQIAGVAVSPFQMVDTSRVSDAELSDYVKQHQDDFKRPGVAYVRFVAVSRVADAADSAAARARVARVRAELARGAKFEDVARRESSDSTSGRRGGDLGWIKKSDSAFVEPFMRAVRALKPGQLSPPVASQFGYHLIRIDQAKGDSVKVRHVLIPVELQGARLDQVEARADTLERLAAERSDPTALDSAAKRLGLQVSPEIQLVERQPLRLGDAQVPDVSVWAFEAPLGETSPVIDAPTGYFVFRLDSVFPAGVPPLNQIRTRVTEAVRLGRKQQLARARADSLASALKNGADLTTVAKAHGLTVQQFTFTRIHPPAYLAGEPYVVGVAFGLRPRERSGVLEGQNGYFIIESLSRKLADSTAWVKQKDSQRAQFRQAAEQARIQQYMEGVRARAKIVDRRKELFKSQAAADAAAGLQ